MKPLKNKFVLLLAVCLIFWKALYAQPHYFRHYQVEDGLSNNAVICSLFDEKGFLWFGTKDGLNRFNGYTFKTFRYDAANPKSIGSNFIHCLYQDKHGILWVGTENGIYQYHEKTETFTLLAGSPMDEIREIKMDAEENLWFIAGLILHKYNTKTGRLKMYSPTENFQATSLGITPDNHIWIGTPTGILQEYDPVHDSFTGFNVFAHSPRPASYWIEKVYATKKGTLLIGTSNQGVKLFDLKNQAYQDILTLNEDKTAIFARDFIEASEDEYWIGTESGIFIYNSKTGEFKNLKKQYNDPYSLSDNAVYTFCKDQEGGIWTGTYFGGLNYYPRQYVTFEKFFPKTGENSISGNAVREIRPDPYGHLWIGTEDGGLNKLDLKTGTFTVYKPDGTAKGIANTNIHGLLLTGDTLWIGTFEHGLDLMNIKTNRLIKHYSAGQNPYSLTSNFIYCIYRLASGTIILGTASGLFQYHKEKDRFIPFTGLPALFYTAILEDSKGNIWVGTYRNGLYYLDANTKLLRHFKNEPENKSSLSNNRINCIFEDSNKTIWIATEGGLCKLNEDKKDFKRYTIKDGFPSDVLYSILEDKKNNLWISTSKGLVCFSPFTHNIKRYTKANGLLSDQFNYNSAYKDPEGIMYFGSVKGLIRFDPETFIQNTFSPPVHITGIQVYNQELMINKKGSPLHQSIILTDTLILNHKQSSFSIDFAALSYTSPKTTEYAYKMEGFDNNWTYLKTNRKAFFTKLPPGDYVFKVKAANSSGIWNEKETKLFITIEPPFWKSNAAYGLYAVLILITTFLIIRGYHHRVREKARRRAELFEHEKEKEVYQAKIDFFTNIAHEIRTPLTLIKGPMEKVIKKADEVPQIKNNLKTMERNTDRLLALTQQLLDFRKTETTGFSLNFTKTDIAELLNDHFMRFKPAAEQKNISFNLSNQAPPYFGAYIDEDAFSKIISNLLDNAIKYAAHQVEITLLPVEREDKTFIIEVKNDGFIIPYEMKDRIFETFYRIKNNGKNRGTGIGLSLARSLAELHKGTLELKTSDQTMNVFVLTLPVYHQPGSESLIDRKKIEEQL